MSIADNIKLLRKRKNMTQKQLAEKSGLAVITIQQYEAGKFEPKTDSLYKLQKALDCNIHEIIDDPIDLSKHNVINITESDLKTGAYIEKLGLNPETKKKLRQFAHIFHSSETIDSFVEFLESLNYTVSIYDCNEMKNFSYTPVSEDDYLVAIDDYDKVTFIPKKDFEQFKSTIERNIEFEIYRQFNKAPND